VFGTHDLWLFVVSGLLLNLTPGPDTLYIIGRSSTQGWQAGAVAALGIGSGVLIHVCAAALGLSALLAASATAFTAVKIVGAVYLIYVGVSMLRSKDRAEASAAVPGGRPASTRTIYWQGFLTNVLNPKVALFFLAFLFLGAVFDFNGTLWNLFVAWSTARISNRFAGGVSLRKWFNRCVGSVFVLIGLRLALAHER
jgi:threonine/homoserine/homoserine lactone efflux protein